MQDWQWWGQSDPAPRTLSPEFSQLLDPCRQPIFEETVPNALDPGFRFNTDDDGSVAIDICKSDSHEAGLVDTDFFLDFLFRIRMTTSIYGYGDGDSCTWPGRTIQAYQNEPVTVRWKNELPKEKYLITSLDGRSVVDTSLHWCYSLPGYEEYNIEDDGVPVVVHRHGGASDFEFDGNPEFFFSPDFAIRGTCRMGGVEAFLTSL